MNENRNRIGYFEKDGDRYDINSAPDQFKWVYPYKFVGTTNEVWHVCDIPSPAFECPEVSVRAVEEWVDDVQAQFPIVPPPPLCNPL